VQRKVTKQGNQWAAATLEDLGAPSRCCSSADLPAVRDLDREDAVVVVRERSTPDDAPKLIAMDLAIPDLSVDESGPFVVSMPVARCVPPWWSGSGRSW